MEEALPPCHEHVTAGMLRQASRHKVRAEFTGWIGSGIGKSEHTHLRGSLGQPQALPPVAIGADRVLPPDQHQRKAAYNDSFLISLTTSFAILKAPLYF